MKRQILKIEKTFTGKNALSKAVAFAGYKGEKNVLEKAKQTEKYEGFMGAAYVIEGRDKYGSAQVFYGYKCDVKLLNKFNPYCSIISGGGFDMAFVNEGADIEIASRDDGRKMSREGVDLLQNKRGWSFFAYKP